MFGGLRRACLLLGACNLLLSATGGTEAFAYRRVKREFWDGFGGLGGGNTGSGGGHGFSGGLGSLTGGANSGGKMGSVSSSIGGLGKKTSGTSNSGSGGTGSLAGLGALPGGGSGSLGKTTTSDSNNGSGSDTGRFSGNWVTGSSALPGSGGSASWSSFPLDGSDLTEGGFTEDWSNLGKFNGGSLGDVEAISKDTTDLVSKTKRAEITDSNGNSASQTTAEDVAHSEGQDVVGPGASGHTAAVVEKTETTRSESDQHQTIVNGDECNDCDGDDDSGISGYTTQPEGGTIVTRPVIRRQWTTLVPGNIYHNAYPTTGGNFARRIDYPTGSIAYGGESEPSSIERTKQSDVRTESTSEYAAADEWNYDLTEEQYFTRLNKYGFDDSYSGDIEYHHFVVPTTGQSGNGYDSFSPFDYNFQPTVAQSGVTRQTTTQQTQGAAVASSDGTSSSTTATQSSSTISETEYCEVRMMPSDAAAYTDPCDDWYFTLPRVPTYKQVLIVYKSAGCPRATYQQVRAVPVDTDGYGDDFLNCRYTVYVPIGADRTMCDDWVWDMVFVGDSNSVDASTTSDCDGGADGCGGTVTTQETTTAAAASSVTKTKQTGRGGGLTRIPT